MKLFDDVQRDDPRPGKYGEPYFRVLNRSSRTSFAAVREFSEALFATFPTEGQPDLRPRFRSENDRDHLSAFFELYWSGWLQRRGFGLQVHPDAADGKATHPDFLATLNGQPAFYIECCVSCDSDQQRGEDARLSDFYNALDKVSSPNFFLRVHVERAPTSSFPMGGLRRKIESWLCQLAATQGQSLSGGTAPAVVAAGSTFLIERGGGRFVLTAVPKSPEGRRNPGLRTYGGSMGPWQTGDSSARVLQALKSKAKRYGVLQHPLVVAVNNLDLFVETEDVATALFGYIRRTETGAEAYRVDELPRETLWSGQNGPANTRVAAILATTNLYPWSVAAQPPILWTNPWAKTPLKDLAKLIGCAHMIAVPSDAAPSNGERTVVTLGGRAATTTPSVLFGLPEGWPRHLDRD